jgi:peptidoglycan hydrolase-like protein with peptidoglycan-binding domain
MTASEIRAGAVRLIKSIAKRNRYTNGPKRERVFDGWGDCSSTVRKVLQKAGLPHSIGSNTNAQMKNRKTLGLVVDESKNGYPNEANLLPGDCLYFKGNIFHTLSVGHVEMYTGSNESYGHGSGIGPTRKNLRDYCRSRNTRFRRYFMAIRWAFDPKERILSKGMSGPDVIAMQKQLIALDHDLGKWGADGDFGSKTLKAVKAFQAKAGLVVDGSMDAADLAKLKSIVEKGWPVNPTDPPAPPVVTPGGTVYPSNGLIPDISSNQGAMYGSKIIKTCAFIILRARVSGKTDSTYKTRAASFKAAGFPHWDYDFLKTKSVADAIAQADAMYTLCQPYKPQGYYLDIEKYWFGITYEKSREHVRAYVAQLRKRAAADGITIKVGSYMGTSRHEHYKELDGLFDTLWPATWGRNNGFVDAVPDYGDLTQTTSNFDAHGADYGCPGGRDMNRLTGRKPLSFFTGRQHDGDGYAPLVQAVSDASVRQGPGLNYKTVGKIPKGRFGTVRPGSVMGWQAVSAYGVDGFVAASQVKAVVEK